MGIIFYSSRYKYRCYKSVIIVLGGFIGEVSLVSRSWESTPLGSRRALLADFYKDGLWY